MNNTAEQDLALQKELLALLIHHVDWRDQFTFVHSLASPCAYFWAALCGEPYGLLFNRYAESEIYRFLVLMQAIPKCLILEQLKKKKKRGDIIRGLMYQRMSCSTAQTFWRAV